MSKTLSLVWFNAPEEGNHKPVLLCIHGWGASHKVWQGMAVKLPEYAVASVDLPGFGLSEQPASGLQHCLDELKKTLEQCAAAGPVFLVGWSLGGQLAALLAAASPSWVRGLVMVASNPSFVQQRDWQSAMSAKDFEAFCVGFADDPALTFKRFLGLQLSGAANPRALRRQAKNILIGPAEAQFQPWRNALRWLEADTRRALTQCLRPQLHILAANDALVPKELPVQQWGEVQVLEGCSHCVPLERPDALARAVDVFAKTHGENAVSKARIAQGFSQAAQRYDAFARIQKHTAARLLEKSQAMLAAHEGLPILDLGAGTGALTGPLLAAGHQVIALDIAEGMLKHCRERHIDCGQRNTDCLEQQQAAGEEGLASRLELLAADAECLPIADGALSGIVSSLAVQWCNNTPQLLAEIYRTLKPGGFAVLATLGPKTLWELKAAWQALDACVHVNGFTSESCYRETVSDSGLLELDFERELTACEYPDLMPLLKELKAIGAHNTHGAAPAGLMSRKKLAALASHYPKTEGGHLAATYDIFYLKLIKPHQA